MSNKKLAHYLQTLRWRDKSIKKIPKMTEYRSENRFKNWLSFTILGVKIDLIDYETVINLIRKNIKNGFSGQYICASPVHPIIVSQKDKKAKDALNNSWLTVPDGKAVVWAARLLGGTIKNRVYGPELMLRSCKMAEQDGFSIFLYGGTSQALNKLELNFKKRFPRLKIAGTYSPPFRNLSNKEEIMVNEMLNTCHPDILFVGLGAPKQEKWMARHCPKLNVPVTMGVGAAFDFISGEKKQAPRWMQDAGIEWLFRLVYEPRRLWKRYLWGNLIFCFLLSINFVRANKTKDN
jgi:N-acetylglucosaminyldiphosphoundecaprenol N-acetyl-beta-D-mannosaminyltransferase